MIEWMMLLLYVLYIYIYIYIYICVCVICVLGCAHECNSDQEDMRPRRRALAGTANCIMIDRFSAFESGLVAPFLYAA